MSVPDFRTFLIAGDPSLKPFQYQRENYGRWWNRMRKIISYHQAAIHRAAVANQGPYLVDKNFSRSLKFFIESVVEVHDLEGSMTFPAQVIFPFDNDNTIFELRSNTLWQIDPNIEVHLLRMPRPERQTYKLLQQVFEENRIEALVTLSDIVDGNIDPALALREVAQSLPIPRPMMLIDRKNKRLDDWWSQDISDEIIRGRIDRDKLTDIKLAELNALYIRQGWLSQKDKHNLNKILWAKTRGEGKLWETRHRRGVNEAVRLQSKRSSQ